MRPLEDVRVVAVEQYGAGPWASLQLADLGAEVIKIEDPRVGGDVGRYVPPYAQDEDSLFFQTFNRNKYSVSLDIANPDGREVFEDLVRHSDAVFSNLRGDVPTKLRLCYGDLKHLNPKIVCCSLAGFGMTGPRSTEPGYDYILQGFAGWMSVTGEPDGPPTKTGPSLVDYSGGYVAAISLLAGVHAARRDGVGMDCDVSLYDTAVSLLTYLGTWQLNTDHVPQRTHHSAHPSLVPFQAFEAGDGWLIVGCAKEKFWQRLTEVLERPELADEPRFATFADRREHKTELLEMLQDAFLQRPVGQWLEALRAAAIPCSPVNTVGQALAEEHTQSRGLIVQTEHPHYGTIRLPASAVRAGSTAVDQRRAPQRGEHANYVLRELLGYAPDRLSELSDAGAFGDATLAPEQ